MLAATDLKMSGTEKKRANRSSCDISSIKPALGRFTLKSCKTTAKKCTTKCAARADQFISYLYSRQRDGNRCAARTVEPECLMQSK